MALWLPAETVLSGGVCDRRAKADLSLDLYLTLLFVKRLQLKKTVAEEAPRAATQLGSITGMARKGASSASRVVVCVVFFVILSRPCGGQIIPGHEAAMLWRATMLVYLAETLMNAPETIANVLQQGYNAFQSVHTMVIYFDFGGLVCSAAEAKTVAGLPNVLQYKQQSKTQ